MTQYSPPPSPGPMPGGPQNPWAQQQAGRPQKGWFGRNWKWFVPVLIVVILSPCLLCAGFGGWAAFWMKGKIEKSPAYKDAVAIVENDPRVTQALGTPINVTTGPWGGIEEEAGRASIAAYFEVEGPKGTASVTLEAQKIGTWQIRVLAVDLPSGTVNLAPGAATQPWSTP